MEDGQAAKEQAACGLFLSGMRTCRRTRLWPKPPSLFKRNAFPFRSWVYATGFHMSSTCCRRMASMPYKDASADTFVGARGLYSVNIASYPGSDYAGAEKRAWYILHAHALNFQRILWICILSVFLRV